MTVVLSEQEKQAAMVYARVRLARLHLSEFGQFTFGWPCMPHHMDWCEALDDESIKRLIVIGPPSSAKTTWVGVIYPARQIAKNPATHFAYLTYSDQVAQSRSVAIRDMFGSTELKLVYPDAKPDKSKGWGEGEWYLRRPNKGDPDPTMRATSLFGSYLSYHFNEIMFDDPHDPEEVVSKTQREKVWRRVTDVAMGRLRPDARVVQTGFRWAEDDVPGRFMGQGCHAAEDCNGKCRVQPNGAEPTEWHVVHTKAITQIETPQGLVDVSYWPDEWGLERLYGKRLEVGLSTFATQYQGMPSPEEGHIFKWWNTYRTLPDNLVGMSVGIDSAYTSGTRSDYNAWSAWAYDNQRPKPNKYLIEAGRIKGEMPVAEKHIAMFVRKMENLHPRLEVRALVRKQVAIDRIIAQHLRSMGVPCTEVKMPSGGEKIKEAIARLVAGEFENERAYVPEEGGIWLDDWLREHKLFPAGENDDQVETTLVVMHHHTGPTVGVDRVPMRRKN